MKTSKYQLKNGMKVLLHQSKKSPVVSVQVWVRTGSADEQKGEEGISHFIEHLVFKGTEKFKTGEIAQIIEGSGGELNAYTSFDQTVFYITISKTFAETAIEALSQMMGSAKFDPTEIDNEREVVIEEIKRGMDSPGRRASQLFFSTMFTKHPYGVPVIGYAKNVSSWPAKKITEYFRQRYSPKNFFLVVTGDFEDKPMKKLIEKHFGIHRSFPPRKTKRKLEPSWKGLRLGAEQSPFKESSTYIGFPIPDVSHKDIPALDVIAVILGQGDSSRLTKKLRLEKPLVNGIGSSTWTPVDEGSFLVTLNAEKEKIKESLAVVFQEIRRLSQDFVSHEELEKARLILSSDQVYSLETVDGISRRLGGFEFYLNDPEYYQKYLTLVNKITVEDLRRVSQKYLNPSRLVMTCLSEYPEKETDQILKNAYLEFKKLYHEKPFTLQINKTSKKEKSAIEKVVFSNGTTLFLKSENETPTLCLRGAFLGGGRAVQSGKEGLVELLSRIWTSSTSKIHEEEIHKQIDQAAASISAFGGRNSFGLNLDCMTPMLPKMLDLFSELLLDPGFEEEHLDRERKVLQNQIKSKFDHPSTVAGRQFMQTLFAGHPYALDSMGTIESTQSITREGIQDYFKEFGTGKNLTFCLVGDVNKKEMIKYFEKIDSRLVPGKKYAGKFELNKITENKFLYTHMDKEQSHLMLGYHGLSVDSPDRYTLQLMESVLAGMGGRLFTELREKNSLAYSVAPQKLVGVGAGSFGAYIGCSPDKVDKALEMMLIEFKKLMEHKVPLAELDRCKRYLIGSHDIELQRKSALATGILFEEIYGLDSNEMFKIAEIYQSITSEDVQKLANKIFSQKFVCSLVGQKNLMGQGLL